MSIRVRAGSRLLVEHPERLLWAAGSSVARRRARRAVKTLPAVQGRAASSFAPFSSLSNFFTRRASPTSGDIKTTSPSQEFYEALSAGRADLLYGPYHEIRASILSPSTSNARAQPDAVTISATQLEAAISLLRSARTPREAELAETMFHDITTVFGYKVKPQSQRARLRTLSQWAPEKALQVISTMDAGTREWNWVLGGLVRRSSIEKFEEGVQACRAAGVAWDVLTYNIVLDAWRRFDENDASKVAKVVEEMKAEGVQADLATKTTLLTIYTDVGELGLGQKVADDLMKLPQDSQDRRAHDAIIAFICRKEGTEAALQYIDSLRGSTTFRPSKFAMASLVKSQIPASDGRLDVDKALEIVINLERRTRRDVGSVAWRAVIDAVLGSEPSPEDLERGYQVYCQARGRGAEIDINMVRGLIVGFCASTPPRLSEAMELYTDLTASEASHLSSNPTIPSSRFSPTLSLYKFLLPASTRTTPPAEGIAIALLNDMRKRNLKFTSSTMTSLTILLMLRSTSHQAAFKAYAHMYALDKQLLDAQGYAAILSAFNNLSWPTSRLAPPTLFLEIVKDMRKAGYTPNAQVYTSLLHRYGANVQRAVEYPITHPDYPQPVEPPEEDAWISQTLQAIIDIHTIIKLDPSVAIDVPLLNALMNAYNRVGAFAQAFEVWDELVERRAYEKPELYAASINVALDACGYSEAHVKARRIWAWARRNGLTVERNWDAWVECLARLGQMQEATEVVCGEMKRRENGAPAPTANTLRILLRFSWRSKEDYATVQRRLREEFPELWDEVKEVVETKRAAA